MIVKRAEELGRLIGQSDEYQALKRANDGLLADAPLKAQLERLQRLQIEAAERLERGEAPTKEQQEEMDRLLAAVQSNPLYQSFVVAQAGFDKLMARVNERMFEGIRLGAESRIITL